MSRQIGSNDSHALRVPDGIKLGPKRAPVSPPETPEPINSKPLAASSFSRRIVSVHNELPPSIMISPCSKNGINALIVTSVALPALTSKIILRGRLMLSTNDAMSSNGNTCAAEGSFFSLLATKLRVFCGSRLYTAML